MRKVRDEKRRSTNERREYLFVLLPSLLALRREVAVNDAHHIRTEIEVEEILEEIRKQHTYREG